MTSIPTLQALAQALRDARKRRGWTQTELARRAGCTKSAVSELETAKNRMPLDRVLDVLGALELELVVRERPSSPGPAPWED